MELRISLCCIALAVGFAALPPPACAEPAAPDAKAELLELQEAWAAARVARDVPFLERFYAPDFRVLSMQGTVMDRAADIANFASGDLKPAFVRDEDMVVSVYNDTAVVTGVEHLGGSYRGREGEYSLRFSNVYVRRDGNWQLVLHHATPMPPRRP